MMVGFVEGKMLRRANINMPFTAARLTLWATAMDIMNVATGESHCSPLLAIKLFLTRPPNVAVSSAFTLASDSA
jgi:hypothetical protein